jgi:small GTP-binding protein
MENYDNSNEIKAILVGQSGVGKTNLIQTCIGEKFDSCSAPTMYCSFRQKRFNIQEKEYIVNLWDTCGQEFYKSINQMFYRNAEIVIFVFDITKKASLIDIDNWITIVKEELGTNITCGLVGNKKDLFLNAQVDEDEAIEFAKKRGMQCKYVSAKTEPKSFSEFLQKLMTDPISANKLKDPTDNTENIINNNLTLLNKKRGMTIKLVHNKSDKNITIGNKKSKFFWFC